MITVVHKLSVLVVLMLFVGVGLWRGVGTTDSNSNENDPELDREMRQEIRFWDLYHEATRYRIDREYQKAVENYEEALSIRDSHQDALYYSGQVHLMLRSFESAEERWRELQAIQPGSPRSLLQLGTLYACMVPENGLFDPDRAREKFEEAWNLNREESGSPLELARLAILKGDSSRAKELLDVVVSSNRMSVDARFLRGYLAWQNGQRRTAEELLSEAERLHRAMRRLQIHGEGATERGAQAMIAEDLFCDVIGPRITELLEESDASHEQRVEAFRGSLSEWRSQFGQPATSGS